MLDLIQTKFSLDSNSHCYQLISFKKGQIFLIQNDSFNRNIIYDLSQRSYVIKKD